MEEEGAIRIKELYEVLLPFAKTIGKEICKYSEEHANYSKAKTKKEEIPREHDLLSILHTFDETLAFPKELIEPAIQNIQKTMKWFSKAKKMPRTTRRSLESESDVCAESSSKASSKNRVGRTICLGARRQGPR